MRLFVAIDLPAEMKNRLAEIQQQFTGDFDLAPVPPDNLHITLKFLGEVNDEQIPEIQTKLNGIAQRTSSFTIAIEKLGYFTNPNYIRVIWVDIIDENRHLEQLMADINQSLNYIRKDPIVPTPHLTLFRVRSQQNRPFLLQKIHRLRDVTVGEISVKEIALKRSQLARPAPIYANLNIFSLGNDAGVNDVKEM